MFFQHIFCKLHRILVQPKALIVGIGVCGVAIHNTVSHFVQSSSDNSRGLRAWTAAAPATALQVPAARAQATFRWCSFPERALRSAQQPMNLRLRPSARPHALGSRGASFAPSVRTAAIQVPYGPGPAGDVQRRQVPRRGWECWTLEMAEHLIFTTLLEMISSYPRWK